MSCMDLRKSRYGSGDNVGTGMPPLRVSDSGNNEEEEVDANDEVESTMELERPGEEKKKRSEA